MRKRLMAVAAAATVAAGMCAPAALAAVPAGDQDTNFVRTAPPVAVAARRLPRPPRPRFSARSARLSSPRR
ncbi:hypothetical protein [Streptomyces sp. NPDC054883]